MKYHHLYYMDTKKQLIAVVPASVNVEELRRLYHDIVCQLPNPESPVVFGDTLAVWFVRATQTMKVQSDLTGEIHDVTTEESLDSVFGFCVDLLPGGGGPLANSVSGLLSRLISYVQTMSGCNLISTWVQRCLARSTSLKTTFMLVEALLKASPSNCGQVTGLTFPLHCISALKSPSLANSASKALVAAVLPEVLEELVLQSFSPELCKNSLIYLLPLVVKNDAQLFDRIVSKIDRNRPELLVGVLKVGLELGVTQNPFLSSNSREFISYLTHEQESTRLAAFSLLVSSPKSSQPIEPVVYDLILAHRLIDVFLTDSDSVEGRNEFMSVLRSFIIRIRDSTFALNKKKVHQDKVDSSKVFIESLLDVLRKNIKPTCSYSQITLSMSMLNVLLDLNESTKMKFPYTINVFNRGLVSTLIINMTSNYEDIRNSSMLTLLRSPETCSGLLERALPLLYDLRGRNSDGGVKVVEYLAILNAKNHAFLSEMVEFITSRIDTGIEILKNGHLTAEARVHGLFSALNIVLQHTEKVELHKVYGQISDIWSISKESLQDPDDGSVRYNFYWKVVKESTALLSTIMKISDDQLFQDSCELIMDQLACVKHRGAFSSIYPSFVAAVEMCFKKASLKEFPVRWLHQNFALIELLNQLISRRSGGLPYLFTGILTGARSNEALVETTFTTLIRIAEKEYVPDADQKSDIPQVHAYNCMRYIFMDSKLSVASSKYIGQALELSLANFSNETWAIRNCLVMLFAAIHNRLFGTEETTVSTRLFFSTYPGVHECLVRHLETQPFAVLTVVSQLESTNENDEYARYFMSHINLGNKDWKIRELSARLLASLLHVNELPSTALALVGDHKCLNKLHGNMLSVLAIIKRMIRTSSVPKIVTEKLLAFHDVFFRSSSVAKVYVDILAEIEVPKETLYRLGNFFLSSTCSLHGPRQLLMKTIATFLLKSHCLRNENFIDLACLCLRSDQFDIQLLALDFCTENFTKVDKHDHQLLFEELWALVDGPSWSYVKSHTLRLFALVDCDFDRKAYFDKMESFLKEGDDISAMAVNCMAVAVREFPERVHHFLDLCEHFLADLNPSSIRFLAILAVLKYVGNHKEKDPSLARAILLLYRGVQDEDEEIRQISSRCLSNIYGIEVLPPVLMLETVCDNFAHFLGPELSQVLVDFKQSDKLCESNLELFERDRTNLYRDDTRYTSLVCHAIEGIGDRIKPDTKEKLVAQTTARLEEILAFICSHLDGPLGYARNEFFYGGIEETLLIGNTCFKLTQDPGIDRLLHQVNHKLVLDVAPGNYSTNI